MFITDDIKYLSEALYTVDTVVSFGGGETYVKSKCFTSEKLVRAFLESLKNNERYKPIRVSFQKPIYCESLVGYSKVLPKEIAHKFTDFEGFDEVKIKVCKESFLKKKDVLELLKKEPRIDNLYFCYQNQEPFSLGEVSDGEYYYKGYKRLNCEFSTKDINETITYFLKSLKNKTDLNVCLGVYLNVTEDFL